MSGIQSFKLTTLVVIGNDYTGSCKSNYYTITTMTTSPAVSARIYENGCTSARKQVIFFYSAFFALTDQ